MTPPPLDGRMVVVKLATMRQLLDHLDVLDAPVPLDRDRLKQDWAVRYAVERILTQLVETAASLNAHVAVALLGRGAASYRDSFALLAEAGAVAPDLAARLAPSAGMRNVLVHAYAEVDLSRVVDGVALARRDYRAYVAAVADWLPG